MYGRVIKVLLFISMVLCPTTVSQADSGQAIVYSPPYTPSRCFGPEDKGPMNTKIHSSLYDNGSACGRRYRIRCLSGTNKAIRDACTGNTTDAMVVGRCEECAMNELKLSEYAFAKIARLDLGRVNIEYEEIKL